MKIEKIPSYTIDLGPVGTEWASTELPYDVDAKLKYTSHDEDSQRTYPFAGIRLISFLGHSYEDEDKKIDDIGDNLRSVTQEVDGLVREYRGIPDEEKTQITVGFRSGSARPISPGGRLLGKMQEMFNSPYRISSPGFTHVDRLGPSLDDPNKDIIAVCHGGTPTTVFEGPAYNLTASQGDEGQVGLPLLIAKVYLGSLPGLTPPLKTRVPLDHAVIFTENTVHRQSAQIEKTSSPSYFLRFIVTQVEGGSQNEASAS